MAILTTPERVMAARRGDIVSLEDMRRWCETGLVRGWTHNNQITVYSDFGHGTFDLQAGDVAVVQPNGEPQSRNIYWRCTRRVPSYDDWLSGRLSAPKEKSGVDCCPSCCTCACHRR